MPRTRKHRQQKGETGLFGYLGRSRLNWLLLLFPLSIAVELLGAPKLWLFVVSALAIVPLAGLIGQATEQLANRAGPGVGGLLNATFGNATELIIGLFALRAGLQEVVKASISGSIIGNILLVLGLSMLVGGWGRQTQTFSRTRAGASAGMLFLAVVALVMPALFDLTVFGSLEEQSPTLQYLSVLVAAVLMITYLASLVFSLKTHRDLFTSVPMEAEPAELSLSNSVLLLLVSTAAAAVAAELLVDAISVAAPALGMTKFFVGVIVVAVVGNAAEHFSAITMAMKNKMDLSLTIATGSGTQIALFVAPVLVFASLLFGQPMSLVFNAFEVVGVALSVIVLTVVSLDGESNWFEGLQLMAVYTVLAIVFYFVPSV
ncbi:MAG: calcium/proton exchanger [Chloroflexi bacterium]|nr:calcium/proton exchanger [Chloroflexota bacterium]